jgi:ferric-dicitrate binding protein FerR (iron transport regulator)
MNITPQWIPAPKEMPEELLRTANEWFERLMSAEHSENLWPDFELWVQADPLHERAFCALEDTYNALADLGLLKRVPE